MFAFLLDALRGSDKFDGGASRSWHIISVRRKQEKKVHEELVQKGIESFQPLVAETRQWSDRLKRVDVPLFPGYGFVHICAKERLTVLEQKGVQRFVAVDHRPAVVPDDEIRSLQLAIGSAAHAEVVAPPYVGEPVLVDQGPLAGIRGIVTHSADTTHLVIPIASLHSAVSVDLEPAAVTDA
jgi:transcriptional antiterminator RfaH